MEQATLQLKRPIEGLPKDDPEAELAVSKFENALILLSKVYPKVQNAEATVKVRARSTEGRKRYEVKVAFDIPHHRHEFVEDDWSLANAFDKISDKMKRLRTKPDKKQSYRKRVSRGEFEQENL